MLVVLYDPATGAITSTIRASEAVIAAQTKPYLEVSEQRDDYDVAFKVVNDKLVAI